MVKNKKLTGAELTNQLEESGIPRTSELSDILRYLNEKDICCHTCRRTDEFSKKMGQCIFHCPKNDWFQLGKNGDQNWNSTLLTQFWKELRKEKIAKKDYDFTRFIFPVFETPLLAKRGQTYYLSHDCNFFNATNEDIKKMVFPKETTFQNAIFLDAADFRYMHFKKNTDFSECTFTKSAAFSKSTFHRQIKFQLSKFIGEASFFQTIFKGQAIFSRTLFTQITDFINCSTEGNGDLIFLESIFSKNLTVLNLPKHTKLNIKYRNAELPPKFRIVNQNLSNTYFSGSTNIDTIHFQECSWTKDYCVADELNFEKINGIKGLGELERIYQQLKRNFENNKNYETAGKFYIREMEMRLRKYKKEGMWKNLSQIILLQLYKSFSLFGESPSRCLSWFLLIIPFSFLSFWSMSFENLSGAIEFSITAFIPLIPNSIPFEELSGMQRAILYSEIFMSSILWFLLLLSINRKFKR